MKKAYIEAGHSIKEHLRIFKDSIHSTLDKINNDSPKFDKIVALYKQKFNQILHDLHNDDDLAVVYEIVYVLQNFYICIKIHISFENTYSCG